MRAKRKRILVGLVAALIVACGTRPTEPQQLIVQPSCNNPAPLYGATTRTYPQRVIDDYIINVVGTDVNVQGPHLAQKYGFTIKQYLGIPAFIATLSPQTVAELRCEPSVHDVTFANSGNPVP